MEKGEDFFQETPGQYYEEYMKQQEAFEEEDIQLEDTVIKQTPNMS
jgi:hypothetical protein